MCSQYLQTGIVVQTILDFDLLYGFTKINYLNKSSLSGRRRDLTVPSLPLNL